MNPSSPSIETRARGLVGELSAARWEHPGTTFDPKMASALPAEKLEQLWRALEGADGAFRDVESARVREVSKYRVVDLTCRFARGKKIVRITFDDHDHVAGLFIDRAEPIDWKPPSYANHASFEDREVQVGTAPALPGTLTLPKVAVGPLPAVVLVHGSGPNDRDETIGGAKPFKDLAWGLASRGIAVLRYEKRSRVAPAGIMTQRDEVESPARDAIRLLVRTEGIDPKRVFLLGHSQGGYLAPRIASAQPELAGAVILAGSTRPLEDSLVEQLTYFSRLQPESGALKEKVAEAIAFKERVQGASLRPGDDLTFPGGGSVKGAYFLDVRGYSPPEVAAKLSCRLLVLQGERDYQVTMKDFEGWRGALGKSPRVTLKTYPSLNHLFIAGSGPSTPAEYESAGHVDEQVVADVAAWIAAKG